MQWFNYFCLINGTAMKKILFVSMLLMSFGFLQAQDYNTGIGLRGGPSSGLTVKHFLSDKAAFEGIFSSRWGGWNITGLYEINKPFSTPRLNWYYGGGAHVAVYNGRSYHYNRFGREFEYSNSNDVGFGINGIIGLEYRLPDNVPIAFSVDLKPFLEITTGGDAGFALDPSIGIRFIIK